MEDSSDEDEVQQTQTTNIKSIKQDDLNIEDLKYQMALKKRKFIVRASDDKKFNWDCTIIILAVYTCFMAPYFFAFKPTFDGIQIVEYMTLCIDFIFLLDIVLGFRTTYVNNSTGDEIYSPAMIMKHYTSSTNFYFDTISCLPFDYIDLGDGVASDLLGLISMFKIARVFRISRIISNLNVK